MCLIIYGVRDFQASIKAKWEAVYCLPFEWRCHYRFEGGGLVREERGERREEGGGRREDQRYDRGSTFLLQMFLCVGAS